MPATSSRPQPSAPFSWVIGDWEALACEQAGTGIPSPAGLCAMAHTAPPEALRASIRDARRDLGDGATLLVLASSIHNGLARLQLLMNDQAGARQNLERSLAFLLGRDDLSPAETEARRVEQCRQLGIPGVWSPSPLPSEGGGRAGSVIRPALEDLARMVPGDPFITIALAERAQWEGDFRAAIQHWQTLAGRHGAQVPQPYYERLHQAYVAQGSFPLGSPEEERLQGGIDKHEVLEELHRILQPALYLEIGVQTGKSLRLAKGPAIGVDPMPILGAPLPETARLFAMSSDAFFAAEADRCLEPAPELAFIDGMHLFEFALRDFINVERHSSPATIVVIDDIFPNHPAQAARERRTRAWTGDVWKLHRVLKDLRQDLTLTEVDASPTGLLIISGLDSRNSILSDRYEEIVAEYLPGDEIPAANLDRRAVDIDRLEDLGGWMRRLGSSLS